MKVTFEEKVWNKFLREGGWRGDIIYDDFVDMLKIHNATHLVTEPVLIFDTEEDRLAFKLKFGI